MNSNANVNSNSKATMSANENTNTIATTTTNRDPDTKGAPLLTLKSVQKHYTVSRGLLGKNRKIIKAVDGIDLDIHRGETLGLVGESGCGKSTLGRTILRLEEATGGEIHFGGRNILDMSRQEMHRLRRKMQIIFQDPYSSLNPRQTVGRIVEEGLVIHKVGAKQERKERVRYLMEVVGLRPEHIHRYPHEFSGGQRQRIGIARALALNPEFIICDEPLSALDVSIQAQVINLLKDLQEQYGLTYLFISHDLSVVRYISDRVAVMYLGNLVELASREALFAAPLHPYTRALLLAIPVPDPDAKKEREEFLEDPSQKEPASEGCAFEPRCPHSREECRTRKPSLIERFPGHWVRCFLF